MKPELPGKFYLCLALHLVVAVPLAWYLNIWSDEASTLWTTQNGVFAAIQKAGDEKQAPLYFVLLSIWRLIDDSHFFARLFSVLISLLSITGFFVLVRRIWKPNIAFIATLLFSVHPYLIWASTEIRVYGLVILLSILLLITFEAGFLKYNKRSVKARHLFTLLALVAFCTNYYLGFLLFALFVGLVCVRHFRASKDYFLRMCLVLVLLTPLLLLIRQQFGADIDGRMISPDFVEGARQVWNHLLTFVLPTEMFPPEDQTWVSFARVWLIRLVALITIGVFIARKKMPQRILQFFIVVVGVEVCFFLLANVFVGSLYIEIRHAAVLFVPLMLLILAAVLEFRKVSSYKPIYFGSIIFLLALFYGYGVTAIYPEGVKRGDWSRVAGFVEEHEKQGDAIIVFRNYEALAFRLSYGGSNKVLPDEKYVDWYYEGEYGTEAMWPKQQNYVVSKIPKEAGRVWLVTEDICHTSKACDILEKHVKENYTVERTEVFYKERVRLLRKK